MSDAATRVDDASELLSELQIAAVQANIDQTFFGIVWVCIMRISSAHNLMHALDRELIAQKPSFIKWWKQPL